MTDNDRLDAQMAFLHEADALKAVLRATKVGAGRQENSAEHSWHLALYALILADHAPVGVSVDRVIRMALIHDIVEIDAGDTPIFGAVDTTKQADDEARAADRLFGLLPADQARDLRALWDEFEAAETPDAQFAKALDRFTAPNQNLLTEGGSWVDYDVTLDRLESRIAPPITRSVPAFWLWLRPKAAAMLARLRG